MISRVTGEILEITTSGVIVNVQGLGFHIQVPTTLSAQFSIGDATSVFTKLIVREDSLNLYGFESKEQRELFELLLTVDGIGPRLALAVLSDLSINSAYQAIRTNNPNTFLQVSGIGKKTAQKIIFTLQDKIPKITGSYGSSTAESPNLVLVEALTKLGYSPNEAHSAIASIPENCTQDIEERLRIALQFFSN